MALKQEPEATPDRSSEAQVPSFGQWVRQQRRGLDLTQDALARRMGYARVTIKKIEADELKPSQQLAERLAESLGVPAAEWPTFVQFARRGLAPERIVTPESAAPTPWRPLLRRTTNPPAYVTSFIGREHELGEVHRLVASQRLVTLTGPGGIGKTRLALQVAAAESETFRDGVWLVELAALGDPMLVPHAAAIALGLREESNQPIMTTLTEFVREKQMLLVLDNCEHLVDACTRLAESLLRSSAHLHLLATSREIFGIAGENIYQVPALPVPLASSSAVQVAQSDAVRLFAERAKMALPNFEVTSQNAAAIAHICRHLDGIPLALELAAARLHILSVEQIAERLDDRFRLLAAGSRTALPRHQTLRALIDWSYELLSDSERLLFGRLAVFVGGCTLEAVESVTIRGMQVAGTSSLESDDILNLLSHLVDKSLVLAERGRSAARYAMLETIRQYAHEKLTESAESELMHLRHLEYFLDWSERIRPELHGPEQSLWFDRLEIEHKNLVSAIEWSFANHKIEMGLRLATALNEFWDTRGYLSEGGRLLDVGLSQASNISESVRAVALNAAGFLAQSQGDRTRAARLQEESLAIFRRLHDPSGLVASLHGSGLIVLEEGQLDLAQRRFEEALTIGERSDDQHAIALSLNFLGNVARNRGDFEQARLHYEHSLKMCEALGDKRRMGFLLTSMGVLAMRRGDTETWRMLTERSLAIRQEVKDQYGVAICLSNLGRIAYQAENYRQAETYVRRSLAMQRELGSRSGMVTNLILMAAIAKGRAAEGRHDSGGRRRTAAGKRLQSVPEVQTLRAARLFAAVERFRDLVPADHRRFELQMVAELREQTATREQETFARGWADGQSMSLEQTVAYALDEATE